MMCYVVLLAEIEMGCSLRLCDLLCFRGLASDLVGWGGCFGW